MSAFAFEYADVSDDPNARSWANVPRSLRRELTGMDFAPIGYAHAWQRRSNAHLVHEVHVSADGRTQAVMNAHAPRVELITLFDDGAIVITQQRPPPSIWMFLAPGMGGHVDDRRLFESVKGDVEALLRRHEDRLRERELQDHVSPIPMDSMQAHFAVRLRNAELLSSRFPLQFGLAIGLGFASQIVASYACFRFALARFGSSAPRFGIALFSAMGGTIAALGMFQLTLFWLAPYLLRLRRGPPSVSAEGLLERAATVPRRMLPSD